MRLKMNFPARSAETHAELYAVDETAIPENVFPKRRKPQQYQRKFNISKSHI
jgi:hypothetical protein